MGYGRASGVFSRQGLGRPVSESWGAFCHAPPESRGLAMGAYTAFLDLSLGVASPALGLIAGGAGLGAVFLASTLVVLCAAAIAMRLLYREKRVRALSDRQT
jgi:predicted MFS family arabinose efflux permease